MQGKESINLEQSQTSKKTKSIKVLYSNAHTDRPKISMEGKWLEQIGFHIGERLQTSEGLPALRKTGHYEIPGEQLPVQVLPVEDTRNGRSLLLAATNRD